MSKSERLQKDQSRAKEILEHQHQVENLCVQRARGEITVEEYFDKADRLPRINLRKIASHLKT